MSTLKNMFLTAAISLSVAVPPHSANAAELGTKHVLTLSAARAVIDAAKAKASSMGWPCVIAVVDDSGLPIILERMDHAAVLAGVELAPGKARTAALFGRQSADLENAINTKRPAVVTAQGFVLMKGGVPLIVEGEKVGALGVSADTPDHDQEIAEAGAAALAK